MKCVNAAAFVYTAASGSTGHVSQLRFASSKKSEATSLSAAAPTTILLA